MGIAVGVVGYGPNSIPLRSESPPDAKANVRLQRQIARLKIAATQAIFGKAASIQAVIRPVPHGLRVFAACLPACDEVGPSREEVERKTL
jgi:hypothetical protein